MNTRCRPERESSRLTMSWPSGAAWPASSSVVASGPGRGHVEDGLHRGGVGAGADEIGLGASAAHQQEGVDDDGLAGAGLPGEDVQAGSEDDARFLEDRQVSNGELAQHGGPHANSPGRRRSKRIARRQRRQCPAAVGTWIPYRSPHLSLVRSTEKKCFCGKRRSRIRAAA